MKLRHLFPSPTPHQPATPNETPLRPKAFEAKSPSNENHPTSTTLQSLTTNDETGASDGIRTHDLLFTKQLLYP